MTFAEALKHVRTKTLIDATKKTRQTVAGWRNGTVLPEPGLVPSIAEAMGWDLERLSAIYTADAAARR